MKKKNTPYNHFWNLAQNRMVYIESPIGQAQYYLAGRKRAFQTNPGEWLLLCRYADTIGTGDGEYELRQLDRLAQYFSGRGFESRNGYVYPPAAREVEKEIVALNESADFVDGYDMTRAMRLLAKYESSKAIFSQPERNLLLHYAFCTGDHGRVEEIAGLLAAKAFSRKMVVEACTEIEAAHLGWIGLETMDGLKIPATSGPGCGVSLSGCETPNKIYPRYALYPSSVLPPDSEVLQNGTLLFRCPMEKEWFRSGLRKVDQTFTVPCHYKRVGMGRYEIAEAEYREMYPRQEQQAETPILGMTGP